VILFCATSNPGKLREFRGAAGKGWQIEPLPDLQRISPPEETGATFEENAILKARYYAQFAAGTPVFAEDSGLAVDALDGAPGVYSARFAGAGADDAANNQILLQRLQNIDTRGARYVAVIAIVFPGQPLRTFRGTVEGEILRELRGSGGFGYDPLFFYPPFCATFAEVSAERKLTVSHRGRAVEKMRAFLQEIGEQRP
jgi:XTP/dITP diphosphohydrolase